jgi:S1-C subfamily serine protease
MSDQPAAAKYGNAIVRFYQGSSVAGTGFRISDRYIMTCAHVVSQCLGLGKDPKKVEFEQVQEKLREKPLEISFACDGESKDAQKFEVEVVSQLWRWEKEDIAIVRLKKDPPHGSVEIDIDTVQEAYLNHDFYVYGFPDGYGETGLVARGKMTGEITASGRIQIEGDKAQGSSIRPGYSGAPVWDCTIGGVWGMAVASVKEEDEALETQKVKIGFMIPADRLNPAVKVIQLFELLFPHEKQLENHWKDAYNWAEPVGSSIGRTDASLKTWKEAIVQLFQLPTAGIKFGLSLI